MRFRLLFFGVMSVHIWMSGSAVAQSLAQADERLAQPAPEVRSTSDSMTIAVLRAQNALMREYDQRLLNTVFWSLGTLGVIASLLLGFGWHANYRAYERDKASIRQDLEGIVREEFIRVREEVANIRSTSAEQIAVATKEFDERFAHREEAMLKAASTRADSVKSALSGDISSVTRRLLDLELDQLKLEASSWRDRKILTNELRTLVQLMERAKEIESDYFREEEFAESLDRIRRSLKDGAVPDASLVAHLVALFDGLPPKFHTEVESLKEALKATRAVSASQA